MTDDTRTRTCAAAGCYAEAARSYDPETGEELPRHPSQAGLCEGHSDEMARFTSWLYRPADVRPPNFESERARLSP